MADPYQYVTATGLIVPDTESIYVQVQQEFQATFGTDVLLTPDTPQGVLATAQALARAQEVQNNAVVANQINPNVSEGIFLDAIMSYTGQERTAATRTLVSGVTLNGVTGTVIPAGSQASTAVGDLFETLSSVTLVSGTGTVDFRAVEYGPIACGVGDLNLIVSNVNGWETVDNSVAGVLGQNTQSDQGARAKRSNTLAYQGLAIPEAQTSALYAIEGVTSLFFQENVESTTQTINGISMVKNSIWVCVAGGDDTAIAAALLENKTTGGNWNGSHTVTVIEPASNQPYTVKFERPTPVHFLVRVTTPNGASQDVTNAVVAWAAGLGVGIDVSPFEISAALVAAIPGIYVNKVEVTLASAPTSWSTNEITIAVNQLAYTTSSDVTVITP